MRFRVPGAGIWRTQFEGAGCIVFCGCLNDSENASELSSMIQYVYPGTIRADHRNIIRPLYQGKLRGLCCEFGLDGCHETQTKPDFKEL